MTTYSFVQSKTTRMPTKITAFLLLTLPIAVLAGTLSGSSTLDSNSPSFNHPKPGIPCASGSGVNSRYDDFEFSVDSAGTYTFSTTVVGASGPAGSDPFLVVYAGDNCLGANDDAGTLQSKLNLNLTAGTTYRLVVTTYDANLGGTVAWSLSGPGTIMLDDTTAPTANIRGSISGDTAVVVLVYDDTGIHYINFSSVEVNSVSVNGTPVSTTFTTNASNGSITFTLPSALAEGDTVVVAFNVADNSSNTANLVLTTTAEAALAMLETASVVAGNSITLTPTSGTAIAFSSSDETIATVNNAGVVTGVASGTATITATDAAGNDVIILITVIARANEIPLTTISALGNTTDATITGGVSKDNGATITDSGTFSATDALDVFATIQVDSNDVGTQGDIMVVAVLNGQLFMKTSGSTWEVWDGTAEGLQPMKSVDSLAATETVEVASGLTGLAGDFQFFVGYQNEAGDIIYNSSPITFTVE